MNPKLSLPEIPLPEPDLLVQQIADKLIDETVEKIVDKEIEFSEEAINSELPLKQMETRLEQIAKNQLTEEGTACLGATKVIIKRRAKQVGQKVGGCCNLSMNKIRDGLKSAHKELVECVVSSPESQIMA